MVLIAIDKQNRKIFGYLCENGAIGFLYCCSTCDIEFTSGIELEAHTYVHNKIFEEHKTKHIKTDEREEEEKKEISESAADQTDVDINAKYRLIPLTIQLTRLESQCHKNDTSDDSDEENVKLIELLPSTSKNDIKNATERSQTKQQIELHAIEHDSEKITCNPIECQSNEKSLNDVDMNLDADIVNIQIDNVSVGSVLPEKRAQQPPNKKFAREKGSTHFKQKKKLKQYMEIQVKKISKRQLQHCNICSINVANIRRHMLTQHGEERFYKCEICNASFQQSENLRKHLQLHSEDRPYICFLCGNKYRSSDELTIHQEISHQPAKSESPVFPCSICGKNVQNLKAHMRGHYKEHPCELSKPKFKENSYQQNLKVSPVQKHLIISKDLANSSFSCHHPTPSNGISNGAAPWPLQIKTNSNHAIKVRKAAKPKSETKKFENKTVCTVCGKSVVSSYLVKHMKTIHKKNETIYVNNDDL